MTFNLVSWSVMWLPCNHYRVCFLVAQRISGNRPPYKGTPCEWTWEQLEGKEVIPQFKPRLVRKCVCVSMILGSGLYTSPLPPFLDGPNGPPALWPNAHNPPCYYHWDLPLEVCSKLWSARSFNRTSVYSINNHHHYQSSSCSLTECLVSQK